MRRADFNAMVDAMEKADDRAACARRGEGHYLPLEIVRRLIKGENRLRVLREYRRLTLDQLATKLGALVRTANLSSIEIGKNKLSVDLLPALARALDVAPGDLAERTRNPSQAPISDVHRLI